MTPMYSICMCNYNMADTLKPSLSSLLSQLDERFEIVLVDDASTDGSVEIVRRLQRDAPSLRLVTLPRDSRRRLGTTWNIGVRKAKGEYVVLHIDCDDVFDAHVADFVEVARRIEMCLARDVMVSGHHINVARRRFLLRHGPYRDIHRGQDRDMFRRLAAVDALVLLDHARFIFPLSRKWRPRMKKAIRATFSHMREDFRVGLGYRQAFIPVGDIRTGLPVNGVIEYFRSKQLDNWRWQLFRIGGFFPAWWMAWRDGPILPVDVPVDYQVLTRRTYADIMRRHGGDPDLSFLNRDARDVFASGDSSDDRA